MGIGMQEGNECEVKSSSHREIFGWEALQQWSKPSYPKPTTDYKNTLQQLKEAEAASDALTCAICCEQLGAYYQQRQEMQHTALAQDYLSATFFYQLAKAFYQRLAQVKEEDKVKLLQQAHQRIDQALAFIDDHFLNQGFGFVPPLLEGMEEAIPMQAFLQQTENDKATLQEIRYQVLQAVHALPILKEALSHVYQQAVETLYDDIAKAMQGYLTQCWQSCLQKLIAVAGNVPGEYAVILLGSSADGMMTPYSDMEWGILVEKETTEIIRFFQCMTQLMHFRILNLGETTPRIMHHPDITWPMKSPVPNGLSFDGAGEGGCKIPLGKVKEGKAIFSLIHTPEGLAAYQTQDWYKQERLLPSSLINVQFLTGSEGLVAAYQAAVSSRLIMPVDRSVTFSGDNQAQHERMAFHQYLGQRLLASDLSRFKPKGGKEEKEGRTCSVKHDFYRLPNLIINQLALYAGIVPKPKDNLWQRIDRLQQAGYWSEKAAYHLKQALAQAAQLRLTCYLALEEQAETAIVTAEGQAMMVSSRGKHFALEQKLIFELYATLVPFFEAVRRYIATPDNKSLLLKASEPGFYDASDRTQGYIYQQLLKFKEAEACFARAAKQAQLTESKGMTPIVADPELAVSLISLGMVRQEMQSLQQGLVDMEQGLGILQKHYGMMNVDVGTAYFNLGETYRRVRQEDKAREYLQQALKIFTEICGSDHPHTAKCQLALGQLPQLDDMKLAQLQVPQMLKAQYARQDSIRLPFSAIDLPIRDSYINLAIIRYEEQQQKEKALQSPEGKKEPNSIETKKAEVKDERLTSYEELYIPKEPVKVEILFDIPKDNENLTEAPKRLLIWGRAGIGKSTFCQYAAYQWSQGQLWPQFTAVVWLPLRWLTTYHGEAKRKVTAQDIAEFICYVLDKQSSASESPLTTEVMTTYLQQPTGQVLFLLDGFDEVAGLLSGNTYVSQLLQALLQQTYFILTSRPGYTVDTKTVSREHHLEILGFTNADIPRYVQQVYSCLQKTAEKAQQLVKFLHTNPSLWGVAHIPINLALICNSLTSEQLLSQGSFTLTHLYQEMVYKLQKQYVAKTYHITKEEQWEGWDKESIISHCAPIMAFLGELAFEGLAADQLILSPALIKEVRNKHQPALEAHQAKLKADSQERNIRHVPASLFKNILKAGLLTPLGNSADTQELPECYFIHLTFQEYFAAYYLSTQLQQLTASQSIATPLKLFIQRHKYDPRYEIVWWFTIGLLKATEAQFRASDQGSVKTCSASTVFFHLMMSEPLDVIGIRAQMLLLRCLEESELMVEESMKISLLQHIGKGLKAALKFPELQRPWLQYLSLCPHLLTESSMLEPEIKRVLAAIQSTKDNKERAEQIKTQGPLAILFPVASVFFTRYLKDDDNDVRRAAQAVLAKSSSLSLEVLNQVVAYLKDKARPVRRAALEVLTKQPLLSSEVLHQVIAHLRDKDEYVRQATLEVLAKQSSLLPEVLDHVVTCLKDGYKYDRQAALSVLEKQSSLLPEVLDHVVACLKDEYKYDRQAALKVLAKQSSLLPEIWSHVVTCLKDEDKDVREAAQAMLAKSFSLSPDILYQVNEYLEDDAWSVRQASLEVLAKQTSLSPDVLYQAIVHLKDKAWYVRQATLKVLATSASLSLEILIHVVACLRDKAWYVQDAALEVLTKQSSLSSKVLSHIIVCLKDKDKNVREIALRVLVKRSPLSLKVLQHVVACLRDKDVRYTALRVLACHPFLSLEVLNHVVVYLRDDAWYVQDAALEVLIKQSSLSSEISHQVLAHLKDKKDIEWSGRRAALLVLVKQQSLLSPEVLHQVIAHFKDKKGKAWSVRRAALEVLTKQPLLSPEVLHQVIALLKDKDEYVQQATLEVLATSASLSSEVLNHVVACLKNTNKDVRRVALEVLTKQTSLSPEIWNQVIECLDNADKRIRAAVLEVLWSQSVSFDIGWSAQKVIPKLVKKYLADILAKASLQRLLALYQVHPEELLVPLIVKKGIEEGTALYCEEMKGKKQLCFFANKTVVRLEQFDEKQQRQLIKAIQRTLHEQYQIKPFSEVELLTQGPGFFKSNPFKQDEKESPTLSHLP